MPMGLKLGYKKGLLRAPAAQDWHPRDRAVVERGCMRLLCARLSRGCLCQGVAPQGLRCSLLCIICFASLLPAQYLGDRPLISRLLLAQLLVAGLHGRAGKCKHHSRPQQKVTVSW